MRPGARRPAPQNVAAAAAMAGAVDLGAVKARSEAAARAAQSPAPAAGQWVLDVDEAGFQADVLDRSFQVPVLLVLTSVRAPSGAQLAADLEVLVNEAAGGLVLVRIDVDANMRIAQALQVQGVPAVFAVLAGQLVPGFEGALGMAELRQFVDAVRKAALQQGVGDPAAPGSEADETVPEPEDPRFDAAEAALAEGDYPRAKQLFQAILDVEPANPEAALALRQVALLQRISALAPTFADPGPVGAGADTVAQLGAADLEFADGAVEASLERLLALLVQSSGDERDAIRVRLVEYFELLGPDDPRVPLARRRMAQALF